MPRSSGKISLPVMTPGTERSVVFHRFGRAGARPKAYLQAAIHANELPGAMALHHLMPMLDKADRAGKIRGEIIVVPLVNPVGLSQIVGTTHLGRYDMQSRENYNRHWPEVSQAVAERAGKRLGADPERNVATIRRAALAALSALKPATDVQTLRREMMKRSIDADIVLDLHCDQEAALHLFTSRTDWPGPAQELAADIGAEATLYNDPYPETATFTGSNSSLWPRLAARFPDAAIPQACLSATIEYRGQHDVSHALGASDAANLYRFLVRRGVIAGRAGPLPKLRVQATPIAGMDVGYSPKAGMVVYHQPKGARVRKGATVCEIIDPTDPRGPKARVAVLARTDGVLFSRRLDGRIMWPGAVLFRIAGAKPLAHRIGMSGLDD